MSDSLAIVNPDSPPEEKLDIDIVSKDQEELAKRQLTFELFSRFLECTDFDMIEKREIDQTIIVKLLESLDSKDEGEREFTKILLRRIYFKFDTLRPYIRHEVNNVFYRFIYETENINGITELMEFLNEVFRKCNDLSIDEQKHLLIKIIVPLHKAQSLITYFTPMMKCTLHMLRENLKLHGDFINGLLKIWPMVSSEKEMLFLDEIYKVMEKIGKEEFQQIQLPMFRRISKCLASPHMPVAERALRMWSHENIVTHIISNSEVILPIIFPSLYYVSKDHWSDEVRDLVYSISKLFLKMNEKLFNQLNKNFKSEREKEKALELEREERWNKVKEMQSKRSLCLSADINLNSGLDDHLMD
ncbi:serine/threonine-protein phosphatase 2A 56 kDa regulatory subunit alpha isoform [Drosophila subpulchrella]|uniref:serine/threonine-protein phosphatase 2A 56 kDa regulatory subunit alpha isoform n=1 Tax=Drosophila subpulchrella TaxID=1486046 RepID=UPI0018A156EF|nr:serine/threonine-protein phosphatase 2A 56 kDa regulatory subunit alpha isoform [Drosophila subpulchrella]